MRVLEESAASDGSARIANGIPGLNLTEMTFHEMIKKLHVMLSSSVVDSSGNVSTCMGLSLGLMTRALMMRANNGGVMRVVVGRNMGIVMNAVMNRSSVVDVMMRSGMVNSLMVDWSSMMNTFVVNRNCMVYSLMVYRDGNVR